MKLYYFAGACSMASHIILNELDASYTLERVDTKKGVTETGVNYKNVNPRGYVPAITFDNGETLTENGAILQYFYDEHYAKGGEGENWRRAQLQEVLSFLSSELHKAFSPIFHPEGLSETQRAEALSKLNKKLGEFSDILDDHQFVHDGEFSPADAYAFVILNWTTVGNVSLDNWPNLQAYYERIKTRPAVQRALANEGLIKVAAE